MLFESNNFMIPTYINCNVEIVLNNLQQLSSYLQQLPSNLQHKIS
ncbi:hypothetical protein VCRA2133E348_250050 [Vibrio crassostreae]|nr:hypothetical protein VCRA2133E348_250050 [Vibrio crassostreae]CAK3288059.1 hypothetical protein VCRA213O314_240045 [Vibrio crassostreae]CAK3849401.1 hypothetical protein VCRA212O16_230050 [Vibrio crassostreae]